MDATRTAPARQVPVPLDQLSEVQLGGKLTIKHNADNGFFNIRGFPTVFVKGNIIFVSERRSGAKDISVSIDNLAAEGLRHAVETYLAPLLKAIDAEQQRAQDREASGPIDPVRASAVELGSRAKRRKAPPVEPTEVVVPIRPDELRGDDMFLVTLQSCKTTEIFGVRGDTVTADPNGDVFARGHGAEVYARLTASKSASNGKIYINMLMSRAIIEVADIEEGEVGEKPLTFGGKVLTFRPPPGPTKSA